MNFTGFCTVAGEDELNRKWKDLGTEADVFCLPENICKRQGGFCMKNNDSPFLLPESMTGATGGS